MNNVTTSSKILCACKNCTNEATIYLNKFHPQDRAILQNLCCRFEESWNSRRGMKIMNAAYVDKKTREWQHQIIREYTLKDKLQRLVEREDTDILKSFYKQGKPKMASY